MKLQSRQRRTRTDYLIEHAADLQLGKLFLCWKKKRSTKYRSKRRKETSRPLQKTTTIEKVSKHIQQNKTSTPPISPTPLADNAKLVDNSSSNISSKSLITIDDDLNALPQASWAVCEEQEETHTIVVDAPTPMPPHGTEWGVNHYDTAANCCAMKQSLAETPASHETQQRRCARVAHEPCRGTARLTATPRKQRNTANHYTWSPNEVAHLLIRFMDGRTINITSSQETTVHDLKHTIQLALGPNATQAPLNLILHGYPLAPEDARLETFLVSSHAVIHAFPASP